MSITLRWIEPSKYTSLFKARTKKCFSCHKFAFFQISMKSLLNNYTTINQNICSLFIPIGENTYQDRYVKEKSVVGAPFNPVSKGYRPKLKDNIAHLQTTT